ncbi:hypothetical protein SAMN05216272_10174 [Pseudomonas panipatensis]|uniref:Uncharacterized protein n=1 Tax=Pseudomonas panipatensis TaxID=428992 RepID=A0A1G8BJS5_9PSED|nr:hypothetical protein SAMN05216272_10174 [Pseudomonas panipatensis]SMP71140.1 hypothetical protein SAMN06295951_11055 [Pseudomonas panipatensis]
MPCLTRLLLCLRHELPAGLACYATTLCCLAEVRDER